MIISVRVGVLRGALRLLYACVPLSKTAIILLLKVYTIQFVYELERMMRNGMFVFCLFVCDENIIII